VGGEGDDCSAGALVVVSASRQPGAFARIEVRDDGVEVVRWDARRSVVVVVTVMVMVLLVVGFATSSVGRLVRCFKVLQRK
jgi:hypothetical protein